MLWLVCVLGAVEREQERERRGKGESEKRERKSEEKRRRRRKSSRHAKKLITRLSTRQIALLQLLSRSSMENMNRRERRRRGFRGGAAAAGNGGGGGGGFGGLNGGPARGGAPRTIRDDEQFAADDPDQEALLSAFADHCQLLPASEEDAREVARMNEGYRRAVAETADRDLLASGAAAGSSPSAPASVVRGELRDLLGRYLQVRA